MELTFMIYWMRSSKTAMMACASSMFTKVDGVLGVRSVLASVETQCT